MLTGQVSSLSEHLWMLLMSALYPGSRFFLLAAALAADWAAALLASITSPVSRACWARTCSRQTPAGAARHVKICWGLLNLCILMAAAVHGSAGCCVSKATLVGNATLQLQVVPAHLRAERTGVLPGCQGELAAAGAPPTWTAAK